MRLLAGLLFLLLLATFAPPSLQRPAERRAEAMVRFVPVPLDRADPERRRVGGLVFLGGWEARSDSLLFGGISAIHVEDGEATAFSDSGSLIRFRLPGGADEAVPVRIAPLPHGPGTGKRKTDRDVEAMAVSGRLAWLAFERINAVWRYDRAGWRAIAATQPEAMRDWPPNRGSEAMLRLPDARFLIFSEGEGGVSPVVLFHGDPSLPGTRTARLSYRPPRGYRITDAALLPDGRLLFLNRRFRLLGGISAKLTVMQPRALKAGMVLEGEEMATLLTPMSVDNMEALAVAEEGGRTILWIASDDNFNPLQRTLLLKFAVEG